MKHNCPECASTMTLDREDMVWICDDFQCLYVMGAFADENGDS